MVYLIRHGATAHNLLNPPRMQGRHIDEPLAELGRRQAESAGHALAAEPLAAVYSSPLKRASQTAHAIATPHGLQPHHIEALAEADVGRWEDRSWDEIAKNDAAAYHAFRNDPVANGYPEGENLADVTSRVVAAINAIATDHRGQQVAVVAHSVVNRLYLGELLNVPVALRRRLPQENCGISQVAYHGDKRRTVTINAIGHLNS